MVASPAFVAPHADATMVALSDPGTLRVVEILGCRVHDVTMAEAIDWCDRRVAARRLTRIVTPNAEIVAAAGRDRTFRALLNASELAIPDGRGLLVAARLLGQRLREQVTGTDLCIELARCAASRDYRVFLLGGRGGVAERAGRRLGAMFPGLAIAGSFEGEAGPEGDTATLAALRRASPVDIVFVALGAGRQEAWLHRNLGRAGVTLGIGCGGALDFISGDVARAPAWVRAAGFDWLFRLIQQPWRWRRQLALPLFAAMVIASALDRRYRAAAARAE